MTLLVEVPPGREPERAYILDVVLGDMLGLPHQVRVSDRRDVRIRPSGAPDGPAVTVPDGLLATAPERWLTPSSLPPEPLGRLAVAPCDAADPEAGPLPALYVRDGGPDAPAVVPTPAGPRLSWDLFGSAFFLLSRYEELVDGRRDAHDRYPAAASLAAREDFLERPLVDEYADVLWGALRSCWPRLTRARTDYRVRLTHDVDHPSATRGTPRRAVLRSAAGDVVRRRAPVLSLRRIAASAGGRRPGAAALDPFNTFHDLMDLSERHGVRSAFYLMARPDGTPFTARYRATDPAILTIVATIAARDHEIGLHGSYAAMHDGARIARELDELRGIASRLGIRQSRWGGRQHYLRWDAATSWASWDRAGLAYDASVGFAERPGFRTGTCREHRVFDVRGRRALEIRERPLTVMLDATLFRYMGLGRRPAADLVVALARRCRRHRGECSLLAHNDFVAEPWARRWYADVVAAVAG